jgi:hypothetical protein
MFQMRFALLVLLAIPSAGCVDGSNSRSTDPTQGQKDPPATQPFHDRLLEIARTYEEYGLVRDQVNWAPAPCAGAGMIPAPADLHVSASSDSSTHGQKLYAIFARYARPGSYVSPAEKRNPVGQVVVKESWLAVEATSRAVAQPRKVKERIKEGSSPDCFRQLETWHPQASKDGKNYRAGRKADLFIMFKLDPQTPGTDNGWVYGTVSPDGKRVTSAGRVENCMACHLRAPHDRLFGPPGK